MYRCGEYVKVVLFQELRRKLMNVVSSIFRHRRETTVYVQRINNRPLTGRRRFRVVSKLFILYIYIHTLIQCSTCSNQTSSSVCYLDTWYQTVLIPLYANSCSKSSDVFLWRSSVLLLQFFKCLIRWPILHLGAYDYSYSLLFMSFSMTIDIISLYCCSELICINVQSLKSFITVWEYNLFKAFIFF